MHLQVAQRFRAYAVVFEVVVVEHLNWYGSFLGHEARCGAHWHVAVVAVRLCVLLNE